jgi:hypothetical protein
MDVQKGKKKEVPAIERRIDQLIRTDKAYDEHGNLVPVEELIRRSKFPDPIRAAAEKLNKDVYGMEITQMFLQKHDADMDKINAERIDLIEQAIRAEVARERTRSGKERMAFKLERLAEKLGHPLELFYGVADGWYVQWPVSDERHWKNIGPHDTPEAAVDAALEEALNHENRK